jgi:hypothetical protein
LIEASGVNNAGQIIANGFVNNSATEAFILFPVSVAVPEPSSAALTFVGLMAAIFAVRRSTHAGFVEIDFGRAAVHRVTG